MCLSRFKPADWNKFLDVVLKWNYYNSKFWFHKFDVNNEIL
jgi:hypothetical protein